jgi:hypothetical protein
MAVIDKVTMMNDAGTTYVTVGEAKAALEEANPHILDAYLAMNHIAVEKLKLETKYKTINEDRVKIKIKAEEGETVDDWDTYAYESHKQELTTDSTGYIVTRVWTDEMWAASTDMTDPRNSIPTIGNGWTRTATFETIEESTQILSETHVLFPYNDYI